ncbi:MFS transporter [Deinococcus sp. Arct2-2]|uniref:MFS transporter n=1 Tax=Deinococcus sp. Arct2-2 TaxID=2568653 RepID=UPI0010A2E603|nr:MFS transporter [Deinococcus sp. Arct2-2]THF68755.1 MFS transporter [Deinococcus sp. Arct2-2]
MSIPSSSGVPANGWRTFLTLWASQSVSRFGSALSWFALTIYMAQTLYPAPAQKAQFALATGALAIAATLLAVLVAPIAGSLADRTDRKRLMALCDTLGGLLTLGMAALMALTTAPFWVLLLFVIATQSLDILHEAAMDASLAMIVPDEHLTRANGLLQTTRQISGLLGPAAAALLIGLPVMLGTSGWWANLPNGVPFALGVDGLSYLLAALVLTRLYIPSPPPAESAGGAVATVKADTRLGWTYLVRRPPLLQLLLIGAAVNFAASAIPVYETLLTRYTLEDDWTARGLGFAAALAIITTITSAGMVLGGVVISAWGGLKHNRVLGILVPSLLIGLGIIGMGLSRSLPLTAAMFGFTVFAMPFAMAHSGGIWQAQVPREMQGRVFAVRRVISRFTVPLGMALVSALATRFPPGPVIVGMGVLVVVVAALQLLNPSVRRVDDREYLDGLAAAKGG